MEDQIIVKIELSLTEVDRIIALIDLGVKTEGLDFALNGGLLAAKFRSAEQRAKIAFAKDKISQEGADDQPGQATPEAQVEAPAQEETQEEVATAEVDSPGRDKEVGLAS